MGTRRTRPLLIAIVALAGLVVARLYQIQVVEHRIWVDEARRLELSGAVLPYERGAIVDARGRPLVEDASGYRLELDYRSFRRGAPLGQVAHARSVLEGRPVPLPEALANLVPWAHDLVWLSPGAIYTFGRGAGLDATSVILEPTDRPFQEQRGPRAADLRYYVRGLLGLDDDELADVRRLERRADARTPYVEWLARQRDVPVDALLAELEREWVDSIERLNVLSRRLEYDVGDTAGANDGAASFDTFTALIDDLEAWRRSVEDAAATALFDELYGFHPGRVAPARLVGDFDLAWLERRFGWDAPRVEQWAQQSRYGFLDGWRGGFALPRLLARVRLEGQREDAERFASIVLAVLEPQAWLTRALDGEPVSWRAVDRLAVFEQLPRVLEFEGDAPRPDLGAIAPLDASVRSAVGERLSWQALVGWIEPQRRTELERAFQLELGTRFERSYAGDLARVLALDAHRTQAQRADRARRLTVALLDAIEGQFQEELARHLDALRERSGPRGLQLADDRLDRLSERARHLIKDYSSRTVALHDDPDYDVVHLLTRDGSHYPGVRVVPTSERRRVPYGAQGHFIAPELVGSVGLLDANGEIRQREKAQRLRALRRNVARSEGEERELADLMQDLLRRDELSGTGQIEKSLDARLAGRNGYRERIGLEDAFGRGSQSVYLTRVQDGESVRLTIDGDLQRAARDVINAPRPDPQDTNLDKIDHAWFANPVGAIVLLDIEGRVLAAASAPDVNVGLTGDEEGERARIVERAFGRPSSFQPIGSVYKPFVALWALDRVEGYDASFVHDCDVPDGKRWAEHEGLRCWARWGHQELTLPRALAVSCNTYFARLADLMDFEGVVTVGYDFGLTEATGVMDLGESFGVRSGFTDWGGRAFEFDSQARMDLQLRRAANGLQVVEATPAAVARAYLTLARGSRVPLRLVEAVGDEVVPWAEPVPLPYSAESIEEVRSYLVAVANAPGVGSAYDSLNATRVGYTIAAKTGSADLASRPDDEEGRVRKHTWLAGWLPADDPQLVFTVFVHDTSATSSHSSAHVAMQILQHEAVGRYLAERGIERDFTPNDLRLAPVHFAPPSDRNPRGPR